MNLFKLADYPENEDYHANPRLSFTGYNVFRKSPLQFKHRFLDGNDPGPTPAMEFGSLVHALALEPELAAKTYRIREDMPLRSKADKERFLMHLRIIGADIKHMDDAAVLGMSADELRGLEKTLPVQFVREDDYKRAKDCAELARCRLPLYFQNVTEAAFYATIEGVEVQCKCDMLDETGQVYDIKTTADLSRWVNGCEMGDLLWADTWYRMVIEAATGWLPPPIKYIGIETKPPHDVVTRRYPAGLYPLIKTQIEADLRRFFEYSRTKEWPGMGGDEEIQLKPFVQHRIEEGSLKDLPDDFDALFGSGPGGDE